MLPSDPVGVVFFDVDGTLVPGTSSSAFLAGHLGHHAALTAAEAAYAGGTLDNHQVCVLDAAGWAGHSETRVRRWLDGLPLVTGIAETVAWCRAHRLLPVLATLAWDPVGRYLMERFGFHACCGPRLERSAGRYTGRVAATFDEYDKRDFALGLAGESELPPDRCAAVGDSRSDLPLFAAVGVSVAFNADPAAARAATVRVNGGDLRAVLPALAPLAGAAPAGPVPPAMASPPA